MGRQLRGGKVSDKADDLPRFLTEAEVAEELRRSIGTVRRLRQTGHLPFIPGRPVMIERTDLEAWIAGQKAVAAAATEKARHDTRPFPELSPAEQVASARSWVLRKKQKAPRAKRTSVPSHPGPGSRHPPPGG